MCTGYVIKTVFLVSIRNTGTGRMRKWPTQVGTVVANFGRELSLLKMAIYMAYADYLTFFLWNELEPRCQQRAAGSLELMPNHQISWCELTWTQGIRIVVSTHWGWVAHIYIYIYIYICMSNPTIIGSDNGLLPGRHLAIIWTNAGILLYRHLGTNFSEILIEIIHFHLIKCIWKCRLWNGGHFVSASMCW